MAATSTHRREQIAAEVMEKKHVTARDLARVLGVSEATIRRDLKVMADEHQVDLVYGGARLHLESDYSFRSKGRRNVEAKTCVGRLAADLIEDGDHIFLDSGTTSFALASFLKRKHGLSIIVNSARLALELDSPGMQVILLGGAYRAERMDTTGPLAISTLEQLRGYLLFLSADGLHQDFGLTASDIESAQLYRLAVAHARETVLLADHSKFISSSLYKIVDWHGVKQVVTDAEPPPNWQQFLSASGITVHYPETAEDADNLNHSEENSSHA